MMLYKLITHLKKYNYDKIMLSLKKTHLFGPVPYFCLSLALPASASALKTARKTHRSRIRRMPLGLNRGWVWVLAILFGSEPNNSIAQLTFLESTEGEQ